jgi:general secretion pathway protein B
LPRLEDLSIGLQQSIPKLAVSGAMVSDDAASRILIINGLVLHEGEAVAPDLRLERIEHKAAVLNYKGTRFLLRY